MLRPGVKTKGCSYSVRDADPSDCLEPVGLIVRTGAVWLHDYLTVEQARELALGLLAAAVRAEAAQEVSG